MATEYGSRLKTARNHAGMTQVALSKKTGIPQSTISTAEREGSGSGETPVYAQACGVDALWLATGQGEMLQSGGNAPLYTEGAKHHLAVAGQAPQAINIESAVNTIAQALMQLDPLVRAGAKAYLSSLCDAPDRPDIRKLICTALEPPSHKAMPETGAKRAA